MNEPSSIGAEEMDHWLEQTANCTIPDRNLLALLETIEPNHGNIETDSERLKTLNHRLDLALNSYCHIYRIGRGLVAQEIDARTAAGLKAQIESAEGLADRQVGLLAKKGADKDSEALLWRALMATLSIVEEEPNEFGVVAFAASTRLSIRQFRILAEAFLHEAILGSPYDLFNRLFFVRSASRRTKAETTLALAERICLHNECYQAVLPRPNLTPAERAAEERRVARICKRMREGDILGKHNEYRPSTVELRRLIADAWWAGLLSGKFSKKPDR